jgi:hypothetical protein
MGNLVMSAQETKLEIAVKYFKVQADNHYCEEFDISGDVKYLITAEEKY